MSNIDVEVLGALIAALGALMVSVVGFIATRANQKTLATLEADLATQAAERNARLEYEFEARKRLYNECAPLLFELSEEAERALGRIRGLARTAAGGDLEPGPRSWLRRGYYRNSTYYRLLAPLAIGKLLRHKLTRLDLSLDPAIHWQYALCKQLGDTFTDDFRLASSPPVLRYDPHSDDAETRRKTDTAIYWQQGVPRGILDNAISGLLREDPDGQRHLLTYGEFEAAVANEESEVARHIKRVEYLLQDFHPGTRPVLWRVLLAQACLYRALILAGDNLPPQPGLWNTIWEDDEIDSFSWLQRRADSGDARNEMAVALTYCRTRTESVLHRLAVNPPPNTTL